MRKYTLQELADLTGLTHGYVRDLECLSIDKTPLLETIGKFADALEIDASIISEVTIILYFKDGELATTHGIHTAKEFEDLLETQDIRSQ